MGQPLRRWVLLADTKRARVVEIVGASGEARTVANLVFRNDVELFEMEIGSPQASPGPEYRFAVRVLTEISSHAADDAFDQLVIAASPAMLRHLNDAMPESMFGRLGPEIVGDLAHMPDEALAGKFGDRVFRLH